MKMKMKTCLVFRFVMGITGLLIFQRIFSSSDVTENQQRNIWLKTQLFNAQHKLYKERKEHSIVMCYNRSIERVKQIYTNAKTKLAYCPAPKVGCTFWKRVFSFLNNETGADSPFKIPRNLVQHGAVNNVLPLMPEVEKKIQNYTRFLFGRNPYNRLWALYIDKFLLPDFWMYFGRVICHKRAHITDRAYNCHNDVTFKEFLEYVVSVPRNETNEHWLPVKSLCDPCLFKPIIVGKLETFKDDAEYILKDTELRWLYSSFDYDAFVEEELSMLTEYNFGLLNSTFHQKCTDVHEIALLLWQAFQLNGYLPKTLDAKSALGQLPDNVDEATFTKFVLETYRSASKKERKRWKLQKGEALRNAYSTIPESLIQSLIEVYKDDFEMFGYNTLPPGKEYTNVTH